MQKNIPNMLFALIFGFAVVLMFVTTLQAAQPNCTSHDKMQQHLGDQYGESAQMSGITPNGYLLETYAHPKTGTWTVILTAPNGQSCIMASGQSFEHLNAPAGQGT